MNRRLFLKSSAIAMAGTPIKRAKNGCCSAVRVAAIRARRRMSKSAGADTGSRLPTKLRSSDRSFLNAAQAGQLTKWATISALGSWPRSNSSICCRISRHVLLFIIHTTCT